MAKRSKRKPSDVSTRERILDEAERLIGIHGYDSLRLRDIAEPIGIRVPSIYGHFDGRDAVLAAVAQRYIESLREQFPYDGESDPTKALVDGVRQLVRHLAAHPAYTRLKLRDLESPDGMPDINWAAGGTPAECLRKGTLAAMFQRVETLLAGRSRTGRVPQDRVHPLLVRRHGNDAHAIDLALPGRPPGPRLQRRSRADRARDRRPGAPARACGLSPAFLRPLTSPLMSAGVDRQRGSAWPRRRSVPAGLLASRAIRRVV